MQHLVLFSCFKGVWHLVVYFAKGSCWPKACTEYCSEIVNHVFLSINFNLDPKFSLLPSRAGVTATCLWCWVKCWFRFVCRTAIRETRRCIPTTCLYRQEAHSLWLLSPSGFCFCSRFLDFQLDLIMHVGSLNDPVKEGVALERWCAGAATYMGSQALPQIVRCLRTLRALALEFFGFCECWDTNVPCQGGSRA